MFLLIRCLSLLILFLLGGNLNRCLSVFLELFFPQLFQLLPGAPGLPFTLCAHRRRAAFLVVIIRLLSIPMSVQISSLVEFLFIQSSASFKGTTFLWLLISSAWLWMLLLHTKGLFYFSFVLMLSKSKVLTSAKILIELHMCEQIWLKSIAYQSLIGKHWTCILFWQWKTKFW